MSNKVRLNMVRDALNQLDGASRTITDIEAATPSDEVWSAAICVRSALANAVRELDAYRKSLEREEENRRRRFEAAPVLQALLRFRDGTTRRVAVSKPTDAIDEPYVGEMFHAALVKQGVAASLEDYPVLVVDRRNRVVGKIPVATADIML